MYVVTSIWFVSRTRATFRSAELGFFGVWVNTRTQTPRFCGLCCSAGLLVFVSIFSRPLRTSWLIVGTATPPRGRNRGHGKKHHRPAHTLRPARSVQALEHTARHLNDATPMSVLDTARPDASASGGRRLSVDGTSRLPGGATRAVSLRIDRSEPIASRRSPPDRVSQRRAEP